jgi:peptide/nickel transport system substrate-binding protein
MKRNRVGVAAILLSAGLVAFGVTSLAQNSRQSTLVYGLDSSDLITLDPGQSYEFSGGLVTDNLYETLVKFEKADLSTLKAGLATSWKTKDAGDSWKVTFKLRKDAKFGSGNPVTADDVVYTFDRAIAIKGNGSFLFTDVANMKVGSTKALDANTVECTLPKTASTAAFLNLLTFNIGGIVDSKTVKSHETGSDYGAAWLKTNSAGSGPFVLNRWDQNQQVVLDANPNSRLKSKLSRIILREMKEANTQKVALESGEIDIAENYTPDLFKAAVKEAKFNTYKADSLQINYVGMQSSAGSNFEDARVRQAVRYAIDQDGIVNDLAGGLAKKIQTIIPYGLFGANPATPYSVNVEKAKELMKAAGKPNGFETEMLVPNGACGGGVPCADLAAKIQSDLAKIGIKVNIKSLVDSELYPIYRAQKAKMVLVSWSPDFPDPDGNATPMSDYGAKSLAWRNGWNNPAAAKLTQQAALESDKTKRAALYKQLTELHLSEGWGAMLYQPSKPIVLSKSVKGYIRNAQGQVRFENISKTQ